MRFKPFLMLFLLFLPAAWIPFAAGTAAKDARLGVYLEEMNDEIRAKYDYEGDGLLITGVIDGSAAEKAGLREGDILLAFDGFMVNRMERLLDLMAEKDPGDTVKVVVIRKGRPITVKVTLGSAGETGAERKTLKELGYPAGKRGQREKEEAREEEEKEPQAQEKKLRLRLRELPRPDERAKPYLKQLEKYLYLYGGKRAYLGVEMYDLGDTPQLARYFGVEAGVLVTGVMEDSPAGRAGIKAGDVIVSWNGKAVKGSEDLLERVGDAKKGDTVKIGIVRRGDRMEMEVTLGERKELAAKGFGFRVPGGDEDVEVFRLPPLPELPPRPFRFEWREGSGREMEKLKKSLEVYKEELEKIRQELRALRKELKQKEGAK